MERRDVRQINQVDDIERCGPDTVKRAPATKRNLNPLDPNYNVPGCSEQPVGVAHDPYGMAASSMGPQNFKLAQEQGIEQVKSQSGASLAQQSQRPMTASASCKSTKSQKLFEQARQYEEKKSKQAEQSSVKS